ncbi:hypothetical protein [Stackebrandtia nassauensis]|uniref:Uncharacterized protein n=1 Tax=Stackebrandtia nassauensis (strain DSM 44728 / CIP 108903 / NRRL B-16338 / NBRC 102104 / LLR-40K-21) TaxID=446470 RepID=D3PW02_STANL|nr:hypothetical protein [Stackebrandtia nassauensis]ADD45123.1 hypothetical protein Snas_5492 [Stackebrandtia nassauensis DSM 44728]
MNDYQSMNVEDLHDMVSVDHLDTMNQQADGWKLTASLFDQQIKGLKADLETARKTWKGEAADRYFLEVQNTIASMENAQRIASGNDVAWRKIHKDATETRRLVDIENTKWQSAKGGLDQKKQEDADSKDLGDLGQIFGKGNNVTAEDYNEKRKPFDEAARAAANTHGQNMEDTYLKELWNPKDFSQYEPVPDPGEAPPWPGLDSSSGGRNPGGTDPGGSRPVPPPEHRPAPELQTPPPPVAPPPVTPPPVTPPPVTPPPVVPPPIVTPPPVAKPPVPPPVAKPPITTRPPITAKPTPPPVTKPPVTTRPPITARPPITTRPPITAKPPTTVAPPAPRPPGRTVPPVIGQRGPVGPGPGPNARTMTGPSIANAQRPNPTVRPLSPPVIGQRTMTGPNVPPPTTAGTRANPMLNPTSRVGQAGMDTRGVFGTRASKMAGPANLPGNQGAGVRTPMVRTGAEGLSRGVILGAKQPGAPAAVAPTAGGARGTVRRRDEERTATIESDGPLDDLFNVDKTVVPGVIRGYTPETDAEHTAGPAVFGERPGKSVKRKKKDIDDSWDDW